MMKQTNKNILLLHGWYGDSSENWFPYLKKTLSSMGYMVHAPDLPDSQFPTLTSWQEAMRSFTNSINGGVIIAHSLGAPLALTSIVKNSVNLSHLILIAPTYPRQRFDIDLSSYEGLIEAQEDFYKEVPDLKQVAKLCSSIHIFLSKDDPYIPYDQAYKYYRQIPEVQMHVYEKRGHFNAAAGVVEIPEIIDIL